VSDFPREIPDLIVTKNGSPFKDQAEGIRQFKEACQRPARTKAEEFYPGTGRMFAHAHNLAVSSKEWLAGWDACLAELDKRGCFTREPDAVPQKGLAEAQEENRE
jgi:hypothetical protein